MTHDRSETLSSLMDGEDVDPAELAAALASPDALEILRDFARLRAELRRTQPVVPPAVREAFERQAGSASQWRGRQVRIGIIAAAAAAALITAGWLHGRGDTESRDRPPVPQRVVAFTPGVDWFGN